LALLGAHRILHISRIRVKLSEYKLQDPQEESDGSEEKKGGELERASGYSMAFQCVDTFVSVKEGLHIVTL